METAPALITPATAAPMNVADIDIGNTADSGRFVISGTGFDTSKRLVINVNAGPYTGKGTLADEAEMDALTVNGRVLDSTTLECFWHAIPGPVRGHFTFQYRLASP